MGPYYQAFPEGGSIKLYADDAKRNYESVSRWSKKDADAMPQLGRLAGRPRRRARPAAADRARRTSARASRATWPGRCRLAWRNRGLDVRTIADVTRLMTMSIADLLDDWFESPQVKGALAVNGVIGTWAGPYEPGTAYVMAHHSIGDVGDGHLGQLGLPGGRHGRGLRARSRRAARSFGARGPDERAGRPDPRRERPGRRRGARQRRRAPAPGRRDHAASQDRLPRPDRPRRTCPPTSSSDIEHWKTRSGVVKINLALAELPDFTADPGTAAAGAPHRLGRDGADDGVHRARLPGRPRRQARRRARSATA